MARAEERLLKSADTFFQPLFRVSVLDNLGRNDPFAEPGDGECCNSITRIMRSVAHALLLCTAV